LIEAVAIGRVVDGLSREDEGSDSAGGLLGAYDGDVETCAVDAGEYDGDAGEYEEDAGEYEGDVGEYDGDDGE
jgi:hypothetical protein